LLHGVFGGQNIFVFRHLPKNKKSSLCPPCLCGAAKLGGRLTLEDEEEIEVKFGPPSRIKEFGNSRKEEGA
jgi:hypothetical protein